MLLHPKQENHSSKQPVLRHMTVQYIIIDIISRRWHISPSFHERLWQWREETHKSFSHAAFWPPSISFMSTHNKDKMTSGGH